MESWLQENYRGLVAEGSASWVEVARRFRDAGDEVSAEWADAQAAGSIEAAAVEPGERAARAPVKRAR